MADLSDGDTPTIALYLEAESTLRYMAGNALYFLSRRGSAGANPALVLAASI
jgi:hypothetical protein